MSSFDNNYNTDKVNKCVTMFIIKLACSSHIDHRNYSGNNHDNNNPFMSMVKETGSIDSTIKEFSKTLFENEEFLNMCEEYKNNNNDDDDDDDQFGLEDDITQYFMNHFGLYEYNNLHADEADNFKNEIIKCLF